MVFANIEYLFLLLLLIPYIVWYIMRRKNSEATLQISDARVYAHAPKSYKNYLLHAPFALRIIALALIIIVLARPQTTDSWQNSEIEGIDIMLAIDVSTSMLAEDLKQRAHKLEKIKKDAEALAAKLEGVSLKIATKVSSTGTIFGSVGNIQIAEELAKLGHNIDRKIIVVKDAVKEVGNYKAIVKLHKEVSVEIPFEVVAEEA